MSPATTLATAPALSSVPFLHRPPEIRPRRSVSTAASKPRLRASATTPPKLGEDVISELSKKQIKLPLFGTTSLAIQVGALFACVEQPVFAVTGQNNYEEDLTWTLIQAAIVAFWYFIVMPPVIMNWLRIRWYKRKFFEMYLQFMCVFLFFPGVLLWAPFLNFRKFPRDPSMKYPWSTPQDLK